MINRLRNKRTGEIGYLYANKGVNYQVLDENDCVLGVYDTLPRLIEEWEEYKLNIWYNNAISGRYTIEIDFATDEEAKKAIDKLKAWQRLKEKGFRFVGITETSLDMDCVEFEIGKDFYKEQSIRNSELNKDLDLLFSGEDD